MRTTPDLWQDVSVLQQPTVVLLKEGTDTSQGKGQLISNINACQAVADVVCLTFNTRDCGTQPRNLTKTLPVMSQLACH